jgi:hypothetical protein
MKRDRDQGCKLRKMFTCVYVGESHAHRTVGLKNTNKTESASLKNWNQLLD